MNKRFPVFFPEWCPPNDAREEAIDVFRMTKKNNFSSDDFYSHVILFPDREDFKKIDKAYGLSVYKDANDLIKQRKRVPNLRNNWKFTAKGKTLPDCGVVKETPTNKNSHITWWIYDGAEPHNNFSSVDI